MIMKMMKQRARASESRDPDSNIEESNILLVTILFSDQLKIDDEAEHYCRVHSPTRRRKVVYYFFYVFINLFLFYRKVVQEKVKSGTG